MTAAPPGRKPDRSAATGTAARLPAAGPGGAVPGGGDP